MEGRDEIKELFSKKLGNYEAPVKPELWSNIASQVGATTSAAASTGMSVLTKWLIGIGISAAVTTAAIVLVNNQSEKEQPASEPVSVNTTPETVSEDQTPGKESISDDNPVEIQQGSDQQVDVANSNEPGNQSQLPVDIEQEHLVNDGDYAVNSGNESPTNPADKTTTPSNETPGQESGNEVPTDKGNNGEPTNETPANPGNEETVTPANETPQKEENTYKIAKLPNVFTPNGDRSNDYLFIESEGLSDFNIVVLDRMNKVVYQSTNPDFRWDGMDMQGNPVPAGRYVYYLTAKDNSGNPISKYSPLQISR